MAATEHKRAVESPIRIPVGAVMLDGDLSLPAGAKEIVLFAHGSGSGRQSPRNRRVARLLSRANLATLLMDLLTVEEEEIDRQTGHLRFNVGLLAERVVAATNWLRRTPDTERLGVGYFGASTGAAAALIAAAARPDAVDAIVSRGGRPDLAGQALPQVRAPTLLIVGENDDQVIELNSAALAELRCEKRLVIVPGATHLFEEPGTLDQVAALARDWFLAHLRVTERSMIETSGLP